MSTFGSIFFALGLCSLRSVKDQVEMDEGTKQKLEIFVLRMTGFSVVVLIPQLTQLCLKFHEANQSDTWEKKFYGDNCDNLFVPCLSDEEAETLSAPSALFIISKYVFLLLPALAPLTWIANGKISLEILGNFEKKYLETIPSSGKINCGLKWPF